MSTLEGFAIAAIGLILIAGVFYAGITLAGLLRRVPQGAAGGNQQQNPPDDRPDQSASDLRQVAIGARAVREAFGKPEPGEDDQVVGGYMQPLPGGGLAWERHRPRFGARRRYYDDEEYVSLRRRREENDPRARRIRYYEDDEEDLYPRRRRRVAEEDDVNVRLTREETEEPLRIRPEEVSEERIRVTTTEREPEGEHIVVRREDRESFRREPGREEGRPAGREPFRPEIPVGTAQNLGPRSGETSTETTPATPVVSEESEWDSHTSGILRSWHVWEERGMIRLKTQPNQKYVFAPEAGTEDFPGKTAEPIRGKANAEGVVEIPGNIPAPGKWVFKSGGRFRNIPIPKPSEAEEAPPSEEAPVPPPADT